MTDRYSDNPSKLQVLEHPLLNYHFANLRAEGTPQVHFREALEAIAHHLAIAVCQDLECEDRPIRTPLEAMSIAIPKFNLLAVSILRAGNGLLDPFLNFVPFARGGHIGLERSNDGMSVREYYFKIPPLSKGMPTVILDPMLGTGGSASTAIARLKAEGVGPIKFAAVVACPEGVERIHTDHPDVTVYVAALDRELSKKKYILPGLGDAGDRLYGTF